MLGVDGWKCQVNGQNTHSRVKYIPEDIYLKKKLSPPSPPLPPHPPRLTPSNTPPSLHWLYDLQDIHDNLMHSLHNHHIYPLGGFIVSTHRLSCPARFSLSPTPPASPPPRTRRPLVTGCTTYRMCMISWCILSKTVRCIPLKNFNFPRTG